MITHSPPPPLRRWRRRGRCGGSAGDNGRRLGRQHGNVTGVRAARTRTPPPAASLRCVITLFSYRFRISHIFFLCSSLALCLPAGKHQYRARANHFARCYHSRTLLTLALCTHHRTRHWRHCTPRCTAFLLANSQRLKKKKKNVVMNGHAPPLLRIRRYQAANMNNGGMVAWRAEYQRRRRGWRWRRKWTEGGWFS